MIRHKIVSESITKKCSNDSMVFLTSSFVSVGDLEEDDRMDFDNFVDRHDDQRDLLE